MRSIFTVAHLTIGLFSLLTTIGLTAAFLVDLSREFDTTVAVSGQLLSVSAIIWAIFGGLFGPLSDRIGRKSVVIGGLMITGIGVIGYSISPNFPALIGFGAVVGIGGAMAGPHLISSVGDYFSSNIRGRILSIVNAGAPLSALAGIPLGTLIADRLGWRLSFMFLGLFMITVALAGIVVLPSSRSYRTEKCKAYLSIFRDAFRRQRLLPLVSANTLMEGAYHTVYTYLIAFLILSYSLTLGQAAPLIAFMAIGQLIGTLIGGLLADRYSKLRICAASQTLVGLTGLALMITTPTVWLSVLLGGLFKALYCNTRPSFFSLMVSSESTRGVSMGLVATSNHIGRALGAMVGGLMVSLVGYFSLGLICLLLSLCASYLFLYLSYSSTVETPVQGVASLGK